MGLFQKKIGTVFLKSDSDAQGFVEKMEKLSEEATAELKSEIEKQIKIAKYGLAGENTLAFELKNSGMDMYVLHDIYLEADGMSAQIDYLLVTRKHIYVIECKNLIGNIEVDSMGNFVRTYEISGKKIKEGIYSPITQNQRHLQVIKALRGKEKNFFTKMLFENNFENAYKSLVVLANPKTYLNAKYAKKDVKNKIVRADQLVAKIKEIDGMSKEIDYKEEDMKNLAEFFLAANGEKHSDYARKYEEMINEIEKGIPDVENLTIALKKFRLDQSRAEGIKPYYIFNDAQMKDLIEKNPSTKEQLLEISGFGKVKVEKYGDEILEILKKF